MPNTFDDRIRGMLLLGAYGDALGAAQEGQETPTPDPLPTRLVARDMPEWGEAWGTWLPAIVHAKRIGMPTDDTCYRLCVLHPWLAAIADGDRTFDEASLLDFMAALRHEPAVSRVVCVRLSRSPHGLAGHVSGPSRKSQRGRVQSRGSGHLRPLPGIWKWPPSGTARLRVEPLPCISGRPASTRAMPEP